MNILVTGGAGFIGTNLIARLLKENNSVCSLDNYSTGCKQNELASCEYINGDVLDINLLYLKDYDFDAVFHLAAKARIQPSFEDPDSYISTNFNGTYEVVKYCANKKIPLIYAGSSSKHNGKFKNPYTFSKDLGEDIISLYQMHYNLNATIARFYNVYGQFQLLNGGYTTLIGRWINNINNNIRCEIYGDGEQRRDFTHVDDIVDALILILEKKKFNYDFELGRGKNVSVNEVATMFNISPIYLDSKPGEARDTLNIDKSAYYELGWNPSRELEDYIKNELCKR